MHFSCYICHKQGNFWQDLESICITKCGHIFHLNCLMMHISSQSKSMIECPVTICNKKIRQANLIQVDLTAVKNEKKYQINQPVGCSLCNDPLKEPKNISVGKCGHLYHFICLSTLVKPKSNACLVSACRIKLTQAAVTQIHFLTACDITSPGTITKGELRKLLEDKIPNELVPAIKAENQATPKKVVLKQEAITPSRSDQMPPLIQVNKNLCAKKNDQINQEITNDLQRECLMDIIDKDKDVTQNQEIVKLKQRFKELEEQMEGLKKEKNDAKKETAIWEMCFKCLRDNFDGTEMMIPNERTLEIMKENEQLKVKARECERERDEAKKETDIWEMCFKYLQEQFKDTDLMIPDQKTLEIMRENEKLKTRIQDLNGELVYVKKDVNMNNSVYMKANLNNLTEENLILKCENETMTSDIIKLKEQMKYLNPSIDLVSELVAKHSLENDTLKELNNELLNENTRLAELNVELQRMNDNLKEMNESLLIKNTELNKNLQTENKSQPKSTQPNLGSFILKELINIRHSFSNGSQGTSKRAFSQINSTGTDIQFNDLSEDILKYELLNEEALKEGLQNEAIKQEVDSEEIIIQEVENDMVITQEVENKEVIMQEVVNEEIIKQEVENDMVITQEVVNDMVITQEVENKEVIMQEVENEMIIEQGVENEEPESKRMKLVLDSETEDSPNI